MQGLKAEAEAGELWRNRYTKGFGTIMAQSKNIGVFVAWPYVNGDLHVGHAAGALLPADIFARFHRLAGNRVLMVSGSDCHGTPITVKALEEHTTPVEVVTRYHRRFLQCFLRLS